MGQDNDASSSAALGAQDGTNDAATRRPGLFERLTGVLSPSRNHPVGVTAEEGDLARAATPGVGLTNLHSKRVEDVAIPRAEMVSVPVDIALSELIIVFRESGLTRLPVFKDTLDTPIGLVHLKDLALKHGFVGKGTSRAKFNLKRLVREVLFVPPSMPIGVLLQKMQSGRKHMALVIDEYGGVDGLVTIEDLIEQVIGEIEDEHDIEEADTFKLEKAGVYLAQSRAPLDEFENEIGIRLSDDEMDEEIDTLGGLVFMLTGRVPSRGEVVKHSSGAEFEIVDADPRRIKRIRVRMPGYPAE
ncbi:transporter associated domain-containing protein [uncultured Litoreibacter sp.]|uniref:transporter associated domain-containing protein n=1 Tax=uncultured Litoreibacter sp. TaxID=1392394 RepID=UPI0026109C9A|nr:transporter associated domain-containing protein [uncultured Litoreibacter sp.]